MSRHATAADLPNKVNLGCGTDARDGWHNVDIFGTAPVDEQVDLNDLPWPWPEDSFDFALMDNVIEHLDDQVGVLHELHRIVRPGGRVTLRFPHWNSPGHFTCPDHTTSLTHRSFDNYAVDGLFNVYDVGCQRVRFGRLLPERTALWLADHIGHIVSEVEVVLTVLDSDIEGGESGPNPQTLTTVGSDSNGGER